MPAMSNQLSVKSAEGHHTCPLCGETGESANDVYVHLQLNHRKSELSEALVDAAE
ncbi:hypothetical protein [Haloarcula marina]|uniref:hypothetical protein n=1 Tax=Haloarcula marina TaxID=2961574 RepID=UPI0020B7079D|nr:hypothetical protein [Halomicroarcula marina]